MFKWIIKHSNGFGVYGQQHYNVASGESVSENKWMMWRFVIGWKIMDAQGIGEVNGQMEEKPEVGLRGDHNVLWFWALGVQSILEVPR